MTAAVDEDGNWSIVKPLLGDLKNEGMMFININ